MRIAFDVTPLIGARTGVGVAAAGMLDSLAGRDDVELQPYALTWRGRDALRHELANLRPLPRLPMAARPLRELWRRLDIPPLELWTGRVDVAHGTNYVVPPTTRRAAQVVTVYDLTVVHFPELCTSDTLQFPGLIQRAVRRGAWVHTASHAIADEIRDAFPEVGERIGVVPLGLDVDLAPEGPSQDSRAHPWPYVLAVGTIEPRKGLPHLVAAFDAIAGDLTDLRLVVAGQDGWGAEAFAAAVDASPFRDRIIREGFVDRERRGALLASATVFAYPSLYEGFGLPPLEAMAFGVPVAASTAGSLREVLDDAALLTPPGDVAAFATSLRVLVTDEQRRSELIARGRERATRFRWDHAADGLVALYRAAHEAVALGR